MWYLFCCVDVGIILQQGLNKIKQYVLANSMILAGVRLVLEKKFRQIIYVIFFTELLLRSLGNGPVNKIRHYMLDILLCLF